MLSRRNTWILSIAVVITVLVFVSAASAERTIVEEWDVQVLDESNKPVSGVRISEEREDYAIGWSDGEDRYTNSQGKVRFSRRKVKATRIYWVVMPIMLRLNVHSSAESGIQCSVSVANFEGGGGTTVSCHRGECGRPMRSLFRLDTRSGTFSNVEGAGLKW